MLHRRVRSLALAFTSGAFAAACALTASRAEAYDSLAVPCADEPLTCAIAPIKFSQVDALPIQWNFDTGWVPQGSSLQVRIFADVWANTHVDLAGQLATSWPAAMTLEAPGDPMGGDFGFHYGADFGAQGKVDISVLGKHFTWQGDLPFVPQFDFQVQADQQFDAWGYAPGVTISGTSASQKIASVSIGSIIGGSIPGIDGGFELDVAMTLDATYVTTQLVVATTDGQPVAGGPFTSADGQSSTPYTNGPNLELDVHPEGTVNYDGTLHLIPAFYVSLLGQHWNIPIVDIPISFPITETKWVFTPQRVHVPLPDLALSVREIDFGVVEVGQKKLETYQLWNAGEAQVVAAMTTSDPLNFPIFDTTASVDPTLTDDAAVRFVPSKAGEFLAQLVVVSNDPNSPTQTVLLRGTGVDPDVPAPPSHHGKTLAAADATDDGACACRAGRSGDGPSGAAFAVIAAAALGLRRRRA